jgi:hypothetical protein
MSIELSLEEVLRISTSLGFKLIRNEMIPAPYMGESRPHHFSFTLLCQSPVIGAIHDDTLVSPLQGREFALQIYEP